MLRQRCGHAGVDNHKFHPRLARHDVDRRAARQEVEHHLRRNILGIAGDALRDHSVISGGHDDRLAPQCWALGPEYSRQLDGELL